MKKLRLTHSSVHVFRTVALFVPMLFLVFAFTVSSCIEGEKFTLTCFESEETLEVLDGKGVLVYTNALSGIPGNEYYYVIVNDNVESIHLPKIVCNPGDYGLLKPTVDSIPVSFQGIIQVLPETIDAGSVQIQLESIETIQ